MISKKVIIEAVEQKLTGTDCFLVEVKISHSNEIVVEIDSDSSVDLDFCASLSRYIENILNRDTENFSLEVGSYGITKPFAVVRQFAKNIGQNVEVRTNLGKKIDGKLIEVCPDYFVVETEKLVKVEGKKRKITQIETEKFNYNNIKYCKLDF